MRLPLLSALLATILPTHASSSSQQSSAAAADPLLPQNTIDIFAWPLTSTRPQTIAQITYDQHTARVQKSTAPQIPADETIVRIGFFPDTTTTTAGGAAGGSWSGIATAATNLQAGMSKTLRLHVTEAGKVWHVGFDAVPGDDKAVAAKGEEDLWTVEVVTIAKGEGPILNKPVVVAEDGQVEGKEPEKTFLQKYWWAIGLFLILQMAMAGGKEEAAPKK